MLNFPLERNRVFGIVLYTGHDCRMMMNANYIKYKRSYFEKFVERLYLYGIAMVLVLSAVPPSPPL